MKDGSSNIDSFDLSWYRRRSNDGMVENLGPGDMRQEHTDTESIVLSGITGLNLAAFSEDMPGDYWCQVEVTNSSGQFPLARSNILTLLRPEDYPGLSVCSGVHSVGTHTCADITQLPSPLTTSFLPNPSLPTTSTLLQSSPSPTSPTGKCTHFVCGIPLGVTLTLCFGVAF